MSFDDSKRAELYAQFVARYGQPHWHESQVSRPMPDRHIAKLERKLGVVFPNSLRVFLKNHGDVILWKLGQTWCSADDSDCPMPIDEFFGYKTMPLANQTSWLAPIPSAISGGRDLASANAFDFLFSFAGDSVGNWFCFRRADCVAGKDDLPVYYFDHEGGAIEEMAHGLDDLFTCYLALPVVDAE